MNETSIDLNTIYIHRGLGPIRFGITENELATLMPNGYSREIDNDGDVRLDYGEQQVRFTFWANFNFKLGHIAVARNTALLNGERVLGKSKLEILEFVRENLHASIGEIDGVEHEDGDVQEWIEVADLDISFWFMNDSLKFIDTFCASLDNDVPNWPE